MLEHDLRFHAWKQLQWIFLIHEHRIELHGLILAIKFNQCPKPITHNFHFILGDIQSPNPIQKKWMKAYVMGSNSNKSHHIKFS